MVCRWPESQAGEWARPNLCEFARHGPWPVRKQFNRDYVRRGRLKPGCQIAGSVTVVWLTTEADDQSSLHCIILSTDVMSDHIGHRGASKLWRWMLKHISIHRPIWMGFDDLKHIVSCRFTMQRSRCNTAEHWQPLNLRRLQAAWNQAHWSWVSMRFV